MSVACVFCKILRGELPSKKIMETERAVVIADIQPQAETHLLVIPKEHVASMAFLFDTRSAADAQGLMGHLMQTCHAVALQQGLMPGGYRTVINTGIEGGQTVFHLHAHVLGGQPLKGSFGA